MFRQTWRVLAILLGGCAIQHEEQLPQGVWHDSDQLGQFNETWSSCYSFFAATADLRWLLNIDLSVEDGTFDVTKHVSLLDFLGFQDRECAISLYRNNDLRCENIEPVLILAAQGGGELEYDERDPSWESTFNINVHDLVFHNGNQEIHIDRVSFSGVKYSNFCGG